MIIINILTNLNLSKNQIQNAIIQPLAIAPSHPKEGQIYYNSSDKFIYRFDGTNWGTIGVVYNQGSSTGAVITGLDSSGNVTTTNVTGLTLTNYSPVSGGYVSDGMTLEQAFVALDTAIKNAIAGGGEVNQNAWSNITVKKQSDTTTGVAGQNADVTLSADTKTDTFTVATGNKWVDVNGSGKTVTLGHSLSGATAGTYGASNAVAQVIVDAAGHVTEVRNMEITPAAIGADVTGAANAVLGTASDSSAKVTVYGARALAIEANTAAGAAQTAADNAMAEAKAKVKSVSATANKGIEIGGTATEPSVGIKLSNASGNAASLSVDGLMVTIPEVTVPEYTITKLSTATSGYLSSYQLQKDNVGIGDVINIPKDYLVKSAEVKTSTGTGDASGLPAGTKYIDFTINTYDSASGSGITNHIYLNVEDLVDAYTPGNGIDISDANVVSAKVVAGNGLSLGANGISMGTASTTTNGAMTSVMVTKLNGIDTGATANTITLNGTATKTPSFYAPTVAGDKDQILVSNGAGAPTWQAAPEKFHKYSAFNADLTAVGGAFSWSIPAATHKFTTSDLIVQLYDSNGNQVIADVAINQTNYGVTIVINDTASAGTLVSGSYRVVIIG
nr:MAG TPA: hypothetical protein [Caudoviricetes sp.]